MTVIFGTVADATARLLDSAHAGCRSELAFLVICHSQLAEKVDELDRLAQRPDVIYWGFGVNRGLAKSWNEGILWGRDQGFDVTIVVNEDVVVAPGDIDRLATAAGLEVLAKGGNAADAALLLSGRDRRRRRAEGLHPALGHGEHALH